MVKILVDVSNLLFASYLGTNHSKKNIGIPDDSKHLMIKEYILDKINSYVTRFQVKNDDVTLAWDSGSWRKEVFPLYKFKRQEKKDEAEYQKMMHFFNEFKKDVDEYFDWRSVAVRKAEGDDIIGTLTRLFQENDETVLILSRDKDFLQLINDNTKLIDPFSGKLKDTFVISENKNTGEKIEWEVTNKNEARKFSLFHTILGDATDGIPSVICDDDHYANPSKKKTRFGVKTILKTFFSDNQKENIENLRKYHNDYKNNFDRNHRLISLDNTPPNIKKEIIDTWKNAKKVVAVEKLEEWCLKNNLHSLLNNLMRNK